jgi:hypothetical protein
MKSNEQTAAFEIGIAATILFTALLIAAKISPAIYAGLITVTILACVAIAALPRLLELNLKEMKLILAKAEKVTAELREMYGNVEHLKREPIQMDANKYKELGLFDNRGAFPRVEAVVNYVMGCAKRERERLARIFVAEKTGDSLAQAIVDGSLDMRVFKWVGPGALLDDPPPPPPAPKPTAS